jgi:hypothetical protein
MDFSTIQIIGIINIILSAVISVYFIFGTKSFDLYYVLYFLLLNLSWIYMANECFFAYLFKKIENADYIMGSNTELTDYKAVLGDLPAEMFRQYLLTAYFINLVFILSRSFTGNDKIILGLVTLTYIIYIQSIHFPNKTLKKISINLHELFCIIALGIFGLKITSK